MKDYTCEHCGGRIIPRTMKCEYCGTQYKIENDKILRIETFYSPVETFCAETFMDMDMLKTLGPAQASEIALTRLSGKLAECIAPMMMIETENDLSIMSQRVRATVKIVRPAGR